MLLLETFPCLTKKDINDKDSEESDGSSGKAQRIYIREKVREAQIFLKLKIHPKWPRESISRHIILHITGVKQLRNEYLNT